MTGQNASERGGERRHHEHSILGGAVTATLLTRIALQNAVPPFATDMYSPTFPQITRDLATSATAVGLTLTAFFIGFDAGQIGGGAISDQRGRRGPIVVGGLLAIAGSLVCAFSPSILVLFIGRDPPLRREASAPRAGAARLRAAVPRPLPDSVGRREPRFHAGRVRGSQGLAGEGPEGARTRAGPAARRPQEARRRLRARARPGAARPRRADLRNGLPRAREALEADPGGLRPGRRSPRHHALPAPPSATSSSASRRAGSSRRAGTESGRPAGEGRPREAREAAAPSSSLSARRSAARRRSTPRSR